MILTASSADAHGNRRRDSANDTGFWRTTFIGTDAGVRGVACLESEPAPESAAFYPVAFLIELDPNAELGAHFHRANQFQVFVRGSGALGRRPIGDVTVHYAGAHSAYGPIRTGADGLHFFTLRDAWDPGARFMPGATAELRAAQARHREAMADPITVASGDALAATTSETRTTLIAPEADGLAAWLRRVPPGTRVLGPDPKGGGGQYWLVLGGNLEREGAPSLPPLSCLFVAADEAPFAARAGTSGLELLLLQFPIRDGLDVRRSGSAARAD